jgi:hypothetical protein
MWKGTTMKLKAWRGVLAAVALTVAMTLGAATSVTAAAGGNGHGNGPSCEHGQHVGNPNCTVTVTSTPTASPTASATASPTATATSTPDPEVTPTVTPDPDPTVTPETEAVAEPDPGESTYPGVGCILSDGDGYLARLDWTVDNGASRTGVFRGVRDDERGGLWVITPWHVIAVYYTNRC